MSTATTVTRTQREPELLGQTVVVIGGSAGIGLETARRARSDGADVLLTGRNPARLQRAALELDALSTRAFDANDPTWIERFFDDLAKPVDHVMVTAGRPHYGRLVEMALAQTREALDEHLLLVLGVARNAADKVRPGGTFAVHGRHRRPASRHRPRDPVDGDGRAPRAHSQPRARVRPSPSQPHRRRLCPHALVGTTARRSPRETAAISFARPCGSRGGCSGQTRSASSSASWSASSAASKSSPRRTRPASTRGMKSRPNPRSAPSSSPRVGSSIMPSQSSEDAPDMTSRTSIHSYSGSPPGPGSEET